MLGTFLHIFCNRFLGVNSRALVSLDYDFICVAVCFAVSPDASASPGLVGRLSPSGGCAHCSTPFSRCQPCMRCAGCRLPRCANIPSSGYVKCWILFQFILVNLFISCLPMYHSYLVIYLLVYLYVKEAKQAGVGHVHLPITHWFYVREKPPGVLWLMGAVHSVKGNYRIRSVKAANV